MNYELAKQLKDAGFPQKEESGAHYLTEAGLDAYYPDVFRFDAYVPTLEELIEACGDRELRIEKKMSEIDHKYEWRAWLPYQNVETGYGPTPTEAVAKLWLDLKGITS